MPSELTVRQEPDKMVDAVKAMAEYACVPLVVKPNAGLPFLQDGVTVLRYGC